MHRVAPSPCIFPPSKSVQRTGTSVTESSVAPATAKVLVKASGWKSLPSWPVRAKTGIKARMIMAMEKKIGPPNQARGLPHRGRHGAAVAGVNPALLEEAEGVLGHHDGRIHQHPDGDGNPRQGHDIGADPQVAHAQKGREHGQRQAAASR